MAPTTQILLWLVGGLIIAWLIGRILSAARGSHQESAKAILDRIQRPLPTPSAEVRPGDFYNIQGSGAFKVHVAGTSYCQDVLLAACGGKLTKSGHHKPIEAMLIREPENPHDPNAVRVEIDDRKVGYLPREMAPVFDHLVQNIPVICRFKVAGKIVGGWHSADDDGSFGVRLDM